MVISADELAAMRTVSQSILTQTCKVERPSNAADGQGGVTTTYTVKNYQLACRLAVRSVTNERTARADRLTTYNEYTLKVKNDADILEGDRVTVGGIAYTVESIADDHQWVMVKRCYVTRVA